MTANQVYRKYKAQGGTLSFKDWIDRERKKGFVNADGIQDAPINQPLNDSITQVINEAYAEAGYQPTLNNKYIFGINRNVLIAIGVAGVLVAGYYIYKKHKK